MTPFDVLALAFDGCVIALGFGVLCWAIWTFKAPTGAALTARRPENHDRRDRGRFTAPPVPFNPSNRTAVKKRSA